MIRHGTPAGYSHDGCRCEECTQARMRACKQWRVATHDGTELIMVDRVGTKRRLQALGCLGWTMTELSRRSPVSLSTLKSTLYNPKVKVHPSTARAVDELYERYSGTVATGRYASRARTLAARQGWASPLAWDDIDNDAEPADFAHVERMTGRAPAGHGTESGAQQHRRHGQLPCDFCREAEREARKLRKRAQVTRENAA